MDRKLDANIFVAGHRGMVGSALLRRLEALGYRNVITRRKDQLDLLDQSAVFEFFSNQAIDHAVNSSIQTFVGTNPDHELFGSLPPSPLFVDQVV